MTAIILVSAYRKVKPFDRPTIYACKSSKTKTGDVMREYYPIYSKYSEISTMIKTKIKAANSFGSRIFNQRRIISAVFWLVTIMFLTAGERPMSVSAQRLFAPPKLGLPLPIDAVFPNDSKIKEPEMNIAYLSAKKDWQLNEKFDSLIAKADKKKSVPVIVGFQFDYTLESKLTEMSRTSQQTMIRAEQDSILQKIESFAPKNVKQFETIPYFAATVDGAALRYLKTLPEITSISEDELSAPTLAQSVPLVGAPRAYSLGYSGYGWAVAVLDTGVDKNHPFITPAVVSEACYSTTDEDEDSTSVCPNGVAASTAANSGLPCASTIVGCDHGTHVAGIAAGNNYSNLTGVAKDSNIISIQVFSKIDSANDCRPDPAPCAQSYSSDQILGLERVMALRYSISIAAVNLSLGSGAYGSTCDTTNAAYTTAITNLRSVNIPTVVASGNDGYGIAISFPACISTAVSVGSTGDGSNGAIVDQVSGFSNISASMTLLAPGSSINSSVPGTTYANKSGTSMAAPHVAGAFAIFRQRTAYLSVSDILNLLISTGLPVTDNRANSNNIVKPRIRIDAALRVLNGGTCGYSISPTEAYVPRIGGTSGIDIDATESDCSWTAYSEDPSWLNVSSTSGSGTGDSKFFYYFTRNPSTSPRTGTIVVAGKRFNVTQREGRLSDCTSSASIAFNQPVNGSLATSDCTVNGQSNRYVDLYRFNGTAGQRISVTMIGAGSFFSIVYIFLPDETTISTDSDGTSRLPTGSGFYTLPSTGNYTIYATSSAGGTGTYSLTLNDEATCGNSSISPVRRQVSYAAGSGSINLTINSGCAWTAEVRSGFLTPSRKSGIGSGTIDYTFPANTTGAARDAEMRIDDLSFLLTQSAQPTAASVSVSGRITTSDDAARGISGATVRLIDSSGNSRATQTNSFGYYSIGEIEAGSLIIISVSAKNYQFEPPQIMLQPTEDLTEINFHGRR